jgi:hypothetical protein
MATPQLLLRLMTRLNTIMPEKGKVQHSAVKRIRPRCKSLIYLVSAVGLEPTTP